jgi:hypothetical protein
LAQILRAAQFFFPVAQLAFSASLPTFGPAGPRCLLSLRLADGWGPVVIPDLRPDPEPHPGSTPELDPTVPAAQPRRTRALALGPHAVKPAPWAYLATAAGPP